MVKRLLSLHELMVGVSHPTSRHARTMPLESPKIAGSSSTFKKRRPMRWTRAKYSRLPMLAVVGCERPAAGMMLVCFFMPKFCLAWNRYR